MKIKNIDHFVIKTANLEKCVEFYTQILGLDCECAGGKNAVKFGDCKINIHTQTSDFTPVAKNPQIGSADFCLIAEGDIENIKAEIIANGGKIALGIVPRNGAKGAMQSIYLYDPDGNLVEIAVYEK